MMTTSLRNLSLIIIQLLWATAWAQVQNSGMTDQSDSAEMGKIMIAGYVDVYYGFDFNNPASKQRPYAVTAARHNELNINLAYLEIRYQGERVRARFLPGIGTYINDNYASEPGTLKNLVEAYAGIKLSSSKNIWLDAGVLGSPYTYESAISKDQLMYSRSLAAEHAPYYLTGLRLQMPLGKKITAYFYALNGWQQIADVNNEPAVGTQLEIKPTQNLLINWSNYVGSERSVTQPQNGMRYFTDLYAIFSLNKKLGFSLGAYLGMQQRKDSITATEKGYFWGQANLTGRYNLSKNLMLTARIEYLEDMHGVVVMPITNANGFASYGSGVCLTWKVTDHAALRLEGRNFYSSSGIFQDTDGKPSRHSEMVFANMTVWF
jgi:hypothetical protein